MHFLFYESKQKLEKGKLFGERGIEKARDKERGVVEEEKEGMELRRGR